MSRRRLVPLFCVLSMLSTPAALLGKGQVFVVDQQAGPNVDFTSVQQAIDHAGEGDLVVIHAGSYGDARIVGKSVSLLGVPTLFQAVTLNTVQVLSLATPQTVVLRGLNVASVGFPHLEGLPALTVKDCAGSVLVEDCAFGVVLGFSPPYSVPAVSVSKSQRLVLVRSLAVGQLAPLGGGGSGASGGAGLSAVESTVSLYFGEFRGGAGQDGLELGTVVVPSDGGAGVQLSGGSSLFVHGAALRGGVGGNGFSGSNGCVPAASGGAALVGTGDAELLDADLFGGAAGQPGAGCPPSGAAGPDISLNGQVSVVPEARRLYLATSPAHVGGGVSHFYQGEPGEFVLLLLSLDVKVEDAGAFPGVLVPTFPLVAVPLGVTSPSGMISFSSVVPAVLPAGIEEVAVFEQALVSGAGGTGVLSAPSTVHVVR